MKVGEAIAMIDGNGEAVAESSNPPESKEPTTQSPVEEIENQISEAAELAKPVANKIVSKPENSNRFYSPLVMSIASQEGIPSNELETITGTGLEGRVTKADILKYIKNRGNAVPATSETSESVTSKASFTPEKSMVVSEKPAIPVGQGDEIIQMDRVRKMIADHMVMSMQTSPHVTSFVEADVTNLVNWRNKIKKGFKEREGQNLTFTPIFIWALAKTIKEFPMINVSVDGDKIIKKRDINMGMAVAQKNGNLIVPVIRQADSMNLLGLTRAVNDLALRARENKLSPDEIQGGTYTLTNVGSFGNIAGTPVINQPQVAIMAVGTITKKPSVLETDQGDVIAIRHKMILSHSYDHRVVDGALGGMFVKRVAEHLENWDMNTEV